MTLDTLVETVLKPFCMDDVTIVQDGKIFYRGYPKEKQVYAHLLVKEVKKMYSDTTGGITVIVQ